MDNPTMQRTAAGVIAVLGLCEWPHEGSAENQVSLPETLPVSYRAYMLVYE